MTTPDTLNPYEQIWQSRDLKALESTPIKLNNKRPEWKKGLNAFVDEMQGTGYGLAALASQGVENVVGPNDITKGITDWGLEGYNRNMEESQAGVNAPKIARVEDVHTASDAMDWASFQLGKGLPMLASLAVPAAIGGTIARFGAKEGVAALAKSAVGDTVKKAVATKALQTTEGDIVTDAIKQAAVKALQDRIAVGAVTGGYLGSFGLEGGQSFGETVASGVKPEDAVKSAIAVGGINGALEFLPFYSAAKSIGLGQYAKKGIMNIIKNDEGLSKMAVALATAKELGGRAVKGGIVGAGAEGITEGLQELTSIAGERWAKNDPLFADLSEDDWSRIKNASAAGALTGATAMGAGAVLKGPQKAGTSTDEGQQGGSSAGGATARPKTREQEMEELRNKINTELEAAVKSGNTARAEQLAGARDKLDMELGREAVPPVQQPTAQEAPMQELPVQGPIIQEAPAQEVTPPSSQKENLTESLGNAGTAIRENLREAWRKSVEATGKVPSAESNSNLGQLYENLITKRGFPRNVDTLNSVIDFLENNTNKSLNDPDVRAAMDKQFTPAKPAEVSNAEAPTQEPPARKVTPPRPGEPIQMQRGEEIILTPSRPGEPEARIVPTEEEKVRLQELMGARHRRTPVQDVTQPDVIPNTEEVQAQTEAPVEPSAIPAQTELEKQAIAIGNNKDKLKERFAQAKSVLDKTTATLFKDATYDFDNKRLVSKDGNYALQWKIRDNPEEPSSYANQQTNAGVVSLINIGNTSTQVKGTSPLYSKPIEEIKSPNEGITTEAAMEEFEAVRRQFQERQSQTPFKKWFGTGTPNITATKEGEPITLYHGTNNPAFYEWDSTKAGEASGHPTSGLGFFMTADQGAAARYGNNLLELHAKINNPYTLTDADLTRIETTQDAVQLRKRLMSKGYDGAVVTAPGASPYVIAFQANQIKLKSNTSPTDSSDMRYSKPLPRREASAPFYSALERATQEVKQQKAPAGQWLGTLDTMVKKGIIRQEELDWSGTKEWLQEQKEPVTKAALLQHVKDNTLEVQETELGNIIKDENTLLLDRQFSQQDDKVKQVLLQIGKDTNNSVAPGYNNDLYGNDIYESLLIMLANENKNSDKILERAGIDPNLEYVWLDYVNGNEEKIVSDYLRSLGIERMFKSEVRNEKWTLPGGENQRELVLTVPSIEPFNTNDTTHYGDVGGGKAVAWVRFNDRADEDGNKTLFIEEVQSKRHQEGKEKGYKPSVKEKMEQRKLEDNLFSRIEDLGIVVYGNPDEGGRVLKSLDIGKLPDNIRAEYEDYVTNILESEKNNSNKISNAPFKQTIAGSGQTLSGWAGLAFKRMLRYAVENGYDKVAWTTGEQQAERYNLSKQVDSIAYDLNDQLFVAQKDGKNVIQEENVTKEKLNSLVGKELAEKLLKTDTNSSVWKHRLSGLDLNIGGEGMKGFYDRLLPNEINKYVKKWGAKVDKTQMEFGDESASVHSVEITPAMRESVMQGQPLFSKAQEAESKPNTQQPGTTTIPLQDFQSNIDSIMGEGWLQQATEAGLVEVIEEEGPNGESGSWAGDRIRLYTGSMPVNGSPAGVLLHEGSHAPTFKQILGDSIEGFLSDLDKLAANGNKAAQKAIMHATIASANVLGIKHSLDKGGSKEDFADVQALIEEQKPGLLAEEKLAYFIQYGSETQSGAGFLRRLVNAIKAWFAQTQLGQALKAAGIGFELNEGMAVEWAKMSLQRSLDNAQQAAKVREQVVNEAKLMPPSTRLGRALETAYQDDPLYSIGIQEIKDFLATDPTDSRVDMVNKPGLLQRWRADFIDFFAEIEKKSKTVYDAFTLLRNKKAARLAQARQEYYLPLLKEIVGSKWTAKQVGDMLAARHHKVDKVNTRLAERASYGYTKELLKALPKTKRQELMVGRVNVKAGKMPDGSVYMVNGVPATMSAVTKQKLMFDLMNKYSQFEITNADGKQALREEWEIFKDAAGGFSDGGVAKGMVRTVDEVLAPASEDQARFDRIMALFDAMNRHALQIREDGGLITADEHARLLMDKSAYAPLKRESYNVNSETARLFRQAGRGGNKNLGTRAGTTELSEPTMVLQNAFALLEASAAAAERNLANQELYKVVNADKAAWKPWFHIAAKDEYVTHDEDGFLQEKNSTAVNRADIVLIKDGKKIVIRPNMHNERAMGFVRAANNLDAQELSGPMKVLGMFNNLVRAVNITFSPIFLMMNAIKDPLTAAYNLQATEGAKHTKEIFVKDYFKTYRNSFRMLKKVFMDGNRDRTDADVKWVERYENAGGRTSFIEQLKENDNTWRSFDAQVARRQGNFKHLMAVKDTWIDGIENLNILFENVMRFSTFRVLVEKGMSDTDAARIAQDLTTNFSRRGYKSQALGLWWLFFNASVQGNYQVVRNLMKSKRLQVLSLGTIAFAVMLDLLGRAIADDWDEIPEWDKERFIIIPVKVGGDYVKIPAPWVYNTLWRTGGLIGEMFSGVKEPQDALLDMAAMTATTFNPLGKPGSIAQAIAPTAADPFIQILENKDFAGNPIGPEGYPGASKKANSELLWSSTPKGYQSIARFVNEVTGGSATESGGIDLKPGDYQLLAKFLTGSMGRFLTDSTFGFAEDVKKGIEGPKDIPVIREFFSDPYDPLTVQKYHTNIASIYGAHRLERMYREGPDRDLIKLQEVRSERGEELRMYSQAQDVERQLKSLRVRLKAAQARDDVGREKQLKERMAQVQEQFNAAYRQRVN